MSQVVPICSLMNKYVCDVKEFNVSFSLYRTSQLVFVFYLIVVVVVTGLRKQITNIDLTLIRCLSVGSNKTIRTIETNLNVKISTKDHHYLFKCIQCMCIRWGLNRDLVLFHKCRLQISYGSKVSLFTFWIYTIKKKMVNWFRFFCYS